LGFMSTEDEHAPGNYGLWDQVMAVDWVHKNIGGFGGDPARVCLFGESAGGYSVGLQSILPQNAGKIQRIISESGNIYSPRAVAEDASKVARQAAKLVNCSIANSQTMVQCLRNIPASKILQVQNHAIDSVSNEDSFINRVGPIIDNDLIKAEPAQLLSNKNSAEFQLFKQLDMMVGSNNAEGGLMYWRLQGYQKTYHFNISEGVPAHVLCDVMARVAARSFDTKQDQIAKTICDLYTVRNGTLADQARNTVNVYADMMFTASAVQTLATHSAAPRQGRSYQYIFTHQPSYTWIQDRPPWLQGMNHAGELPFVFGLDLLYPRNHAKSEEERRLSDLVMSFWTNFAKHG